MRGVGSTELGRKSYKDPGLGAEQASDWHEIQSEEQRPYECLPSRSMGVESQRRELGENQKVTPGPAPELS